MGVGQCYRASSAQIRRELAPESRFRRARGRGGLGWAGVEAAPAALLRAPREVRLFPGQRCGRAGADVPRVQRKRRGQGRLRASGRGESPALKTGISPSVKGASSLVLTTFLGPRDTRVDLGEGGVVAAFISGSPVVRHAHPLLRQGSCPSPRLPLSLAARTSWRPRCSNPGALPPWCLRLAALCRCGWSPGTLGGVSEFVRGFKNKKSI